MIRRLLFCLCIILSSNYTLANAIDKLTEKILLRLQTNALLSLKIALSDEYNKKIDSGNFVFSKTQKSNGPSILGMAFTKGKDFVCNLVLNDDDLRSFYQSLKFFMTGQNKNNRNIKKVFEIGVTSQFKNVMACKIKENRYAGVQKILQLEVIRSFSTKSNLNVFNLRMPPVKNINDDSVVSGPVLIIVEHDAKKLFKALKKYLLGE